MRLNLQNLLDPFKSLGASCHICRPSFNIVDRSELATAFRGVQASNSPKRSADLSSYVGEKGVKGSVTALADNKLATLILVVAVTEDRDMFSGRCID